MMEESGISSSVKKRCLGFPAIFGVSAVFLFLWRGTTVALCDAFFFSLPVATREFGAHPCNINFDSEHGRLRIQRVKEPTKKHDQNTCSGRIYSCHSSISSHHNEGGDDEEEDKNEDNINTSRDYSFLMVRSSSRRKMLRSTPGTIAAAVFGTTSLAGVPSITFGEESDSSENISTTYTSQNADSSIRDRNKINDIATGRKNESSLHRVLESSSVYRVKTAPTVRLTGRRTPVVPALDAKPPSVHRMASQNLLRDLQSKRALVLGEHHPDPRDHLLQAALIRDLHKARRHSGSGSSEMAVGLEAVQQQFQPFLDAYVEGILDNDELKVATEWESRWYWSFDAYLPVLRTCRDLGIPLLALDLSSEDRTTVERGGLESLSLDRLNNYVPDPDAFRSFGSTAAYRAYLDYTLRPPYELLQRMAKQGPASSNSSGIPFSTFVERQMLRDEAMASASTRWLRHHPDGLLVACVGTNHASFGCGVPGRIARTLASNSGEKRGRAAVASVLINPEPLNTGTELRICNKDGTLATNDYDDEESPTRIGFLPNSGNQVCIENSTDLQNYALQFQFASFSLSPSQQQGILQEATLAQQTAEGENVLGLADYLVFSPKEKT